MNESKVETKRPSEHDPKVVAIHMAAIRERVGEYVARNDAVGDGEDMDTVMADVERAMDLESDGYRIAAQLEGHGWTVDARLVEFMHGLVRDRYEAHRQVVRDWVIAEGIKPVFSVGDWVVFESPRRFGKVEGEIIKIFGDQAKYLVFIPSEGHVREGLGTLGTHVPFEDVRASGPPAAVSGGKPTQEPV
jgi:hypothetical protein